MTFSFLAAIARESVGREHYMQLSGLRSGVFGGFSFGNVEGYVVLAVLSPPAN